VSIGTAAVQKPSLIKEAAKQFGSQCIIVSIDPKKVANNKWQVFVKGGREQTGMDAVNFAKEAERLGAGEILVNSMDRDGTKLGYDLELTKAISEAVSIPIIASSGAGKKEHFLEAFTIGQADAALAASLFHYRELEIKELKKYLFKNNMPVRL
jgi:cyclase